MIDWKIVSYIVRQADIKPYSICVSMYRVQQVAATTRECGTHLATEVDMVPVLAMVATAGHRAMVEAMTTAAIRHRVVMDSLIRTASSTEVYIVITSLIMLDSRYLARNYNVDSIL